MAYYREHEHQQAQQSQQHSSWFYAAAFATIALVALLQDVNRFSGLDDLRDQDQQIKWAASGIICALGLACIGFLLGLFLRHRFVGNILELILAILTVGIWAAVLPTLMNPNNEIATEGEFGQIVNANLFVFPWLGLVASISVLAGSMKLFFDRDVRATEKSGWGFVGWGAFVGTSLIVMMAAARQYRDMDCDTDDTTMCSRLQYATWVGAIGGFLAFIWMMVDLCLPTRMGLVEAILAVLVLVAWCFGITYITFGDNAPAPSFSTLYFFSWASFAIAASLVAGTVYQLLGYIIPGGDEDESEDVHHAGGKEVDHSEEDEEERGRGAVVEEDEGVAAVPPTNVSTAQSQVYK